MQKNVFIGRATSAIMYDEALKKAVVYLRSTEYATASEEGGQRTIQVAVPFTAFNDLAEFLKDKVNKGDQLIVDYVIRNNDYESGGAQVHSFDFIVKEIEFGAPGRDTQAFLERKVFKGASESNG
jgi:single-stranded DNA-binding protein